jgi:LemA protein
MNKFESFAKWFFYGMLGVAGTVALFLAGLMIAGCGLLDSGVQKYDTLVDKDEKCEQAWSDYESNLQRRADMIPQLVSVVRGSAAHEEDTLTAVMTARAAATQIKLTGEDLTDPVKVEAFQKAQAQLKGSLSRLMMVQENYPALQANAAFHTLQVQIEGTENRLLRAREEYNKVVQSYNLELRRVSGKVINPVTGHEFKPRVYFKMDQGAEKAPTIDFSKPKVDGGK